MDLKDLYHKTPTIQSTILSKAIGSPVFLKLENVQKTGSFKQRGIGYFCWRAVHERGNCVLFTFILTLLGCTSFVSSSGGNAGIAAAYSAKVLGKPITVFVPDNVHPRLKRKMELEGANVVVHGKVWAEAHQKAMEYAKAVPHCEIVHPFDDEDLWEGHASIITEAAGDLRKKPQAVVCVVGGGGLMVGLLRGMHKVGWEDVPLVVSETTGAASFAAAVEAGKLVTLPSINTIAKTLGASTVAQEAFDWTKKHRIIHRVVTDREVLEAIIQFQEDHQFLVEPSCGAGLALLYSEKHSNFLKTHLQKESQKDREGILVVICGGNGVDIDMIQEWNKNKASL